jgi:hypothetical protein
VALLRRELASRFSWGDTARLDGGHALRGSGPRRIGFEEANFDLIRDIVSLLAGASGCASQPRNVLWRWSVLAARVPRALRLGHRVKLPRRDNPMLDEEGHQLGVEGFPLFRANVRHPIDDDLDRRIHPNICPILRRSAP